MYQNIKNNIKRFLPKSILCIYRFFRDLKSVISLTQFLFTCYPKTTFIERWKIIEKLSIVSYRVDCPHTQYEIITFISTILSIPEHVRGCIVECGCYKGGSSAKFSLVTKIVNRKLIIFDSFKGMPTHDEPHDKNIFGGLASFPQGSYCGTLDEVRKNIDRFGELSICEFIEGWFDNTMPKFSETICAIYLDVDLASSTRSSLKYLYPLLVPGGIIYSQDGHLPLILDVFNDDKFWEKEIGFKKPYIEGFGKRKLLKIIKPIE